ncbi:adenylyltransferase/cytidyltransferase family protein (plasmid) [Halobaculum sp. CBA1158]|uniref:adenylyltransferase/cytidyltransferase family protein n=1 Tax=Halobaculum sp. CBA1158 TaxID=2904243 RepID=UPI001F277409|nr:adenylyltransferase/cytidyltransferase family protein [Halobaculum sp. CBA1158]UIP01334.1 adenylyltransferase/cytidyltransferase family protein [Halobaculum sp. CBA1158]
MREGGVPGDAASDRLDVDRVVGHVHGRFQPFHDGHLAYCEWAAGECDELLVGVTNADPAHVRSESADPDRDDPRNNPFRYHERHRMVTAALSAVDLGVPVRVLPFPINRPELWEHYAPVDALHLVRVLEDWHEIKVDRLREHGRTVHTTAAERTVSGTAIREAMAAGGRADDHDTGEGDGWRTSVPAPVAAVIDDLDGVSRVRSLYEE